METREGESVDVEMLAAVSQLKNGDNTGFEYLYNLTVGTAKYIAVKMIKNENDAMDIVHDAYITMLNKIDTLREDSKFTAWFYKIVTNKSYDYLRKNKPILFGEMESEEDGREIEFEDERTEFRPEENVDYKETSRIMGEVIDALPEDQRMCIYMFYFNQMSIRDIAEQLVCNENTIKSRLNYAKKRLVKIVEGKERQGICIRSINVVPFIMWMLRGEAEESQVSGAAELLESIMGECNLSSASSSQMIGNTVENIAADIVEGAAENVATNVTANTAGTVVGKSVIATIGKFAITKQLIVGVAAAAIVIGGGTATYHIYKSQAQQTASKEDAKEQSKDKAKEEATATSDNDAKEDSSSENEESKRTPTDLYDADKLAIIEDSVSKLGGDEWLDGETTKDATSLNDIQYSEILWNQIESQTFGDSSSVNSEVVSERFEALWNRKINNDDLSPAIGYSDGKYSSMASGSPMEYRKTDIVNAYETEDGLELEGISYIRTQDGSLEDEDIRNVVVSMKKNDSATYYDGYNTVLAMGTFTNMTFFIALKGMWIEYIIIFLLAYFVSGNIAKYFAFRVVQPGDRPIFIIFSIQIFTVVAQVAFASVIGVYHGYGFTSNFIPDYLITYCKNFVMALPLQLILVGPLVRLIFRSIFVKGQKVQTTSEIQEMDEKIVEKAM